MKPNRYGEGAPPVPRRPRALSANESEKARSGIPVLASRPRSFVEPKGGPRHLDALPGPAGERPPSARAPSSFEDKVESALGELHFKTLLRIDGLFEGTLNSNGSLVVGPLGAVVGPVSGLKLVHCSGRITGDVASDKIVLTASAFVEGNILARRVVIEEGAVVHGKWSVYRHAPDTLDMDDEGNIIRRPAVAGDGLSGAEESPAARSTTRSQASSATPKAVVPEAVIAPLEAAAEAQEEKKDEAVVPIEEVVVEKVSSPPKALEVAAAVEEEEEDEAAAEAVMLAAPPSPPPVVPEPPAVPLTTSAPEPEVVTEPESVPEPLAVTSPVAETLQAPAVEPPAPLHPAPSPDIVTPTHVPVELPAAPPEPASTPAEPEGGEGDAAHSHHDKHKHKHKGHHSKHHEPPSPSPHTTEDHLPPVALHGHSTPILGADAILPAPEAAAPDPPPPVEPLLPVSVPDEPEGDVVTLDELEEAVPAQHVEAQAEAVVEPVDVPAPVPEAPPAVPEPVPDAPASVPDVPPEPVTVSALDSNAPAAAAPDSEPIPEPAPVPEAAPAPEPEPAPPRVPTPPAVVPPSPPAAPAPAPVTEARVEADLSGSLRARRSMTRKEPPPIMAIVE